MGLLNLIEDSPSFRTDDRLSATLLNIIRQNILVLDEVSRLGRHAHCANFGEPPENNSANPVTIWRGAWQHLAGMTTLTIVTFTVGQQSGDTLRVYRTNGTSEVSTDHTLANGLQTHTITISGAGYVEGDVIEVRADLRHATPGDRDWGNVDIRDAYVSPVDLPDAYVAPTVFGALSAANLNALSNATDWLVRRIGQRREPLFQASIRRPGPFNDDGSSQLTVRWTGSLRKTAGHGTVTALIAVQQKASGRTETIRFRVNGSQVASYSVPGTPGDYTTTLTYDMSAQANGTLLWLEIDHVKTAPAPDSGDTSRLSILRVRSEPVAGAPITNIPELSMRTPITYGPSGTEGTLLTFLNRCVNSCTAIKARIDANPEIWSRQPLYRRRYGIDDYQMRVYEPWSIASQLSRLGEALVLRGKGLTIGYGPGSFKEGKEAYNEVGAQLVENYRTFSAIDGDAVENLQLYLDTVEGLYAGGAYNVRGEDLRYAAEVFKVTGAG